MLQAFISNILPQLVQVGVLSFMTGIQAATLRYVLVGIGLMLIVIYSPQGILGNRKESTFVK
jgi:branched-chain amino acid transport system permease protein